MDTTTPLRWPADDVREDFHEAVPDQPPTEEFAGPRAVRLVRDWHACAGGEVNLAGRLPAVPLAPARVGRPRCPVGPSDRRCRCCGERKANRPRGLCWRCFYTPGARDAFPSIEPTGRRGVSGGNAALPPPAEPTAARPGSAEKVVVLAARAAAGMSLWHSNDARQDDGGEDPECPLPVFGAGDGTRKENASPRR